MIIHHDPRDGVALAAFKSEWWPASRRNSGRLQDRYPRPASSEYPLWEERQVVSVANLTRQDATDFLAIAPKAGIRTETVPYPLERANEALADLREGRLQGAAVLIP